MEIAILIILLGVFGPSILFLLITGKRKKPAAWETFNKLEGRRGLVYWEGERVPKTAVFTKPSPGWPMTLVFEVVEVQRAVSNGVAMSRLVYGPGKGEEPHLIESARQNFVRTWLPSREVQWLEEKK